MNRLIQFGEDNFVHAHFAKAGFGAVLERLVRTRSITALRLIDVPIYDETELDDPDKVAHVATFTVR